MITLETNKSRDRLGLRCKDVSLKLKDRPLGLEFSPRS